MPESYAMARTGVRRRGCGHGDARVRVVAGAAPRSEADRVGALPRDPGSQRRLADPAGGLDVANGDRDVVEELHSQEAGAGCGGRGRPRASGGSDGNCRGSFGGADHARAASTLAAAMISRSH